jgi:hypothetical protein
MQAEKSDKSQWWMPLLGDDAQLLLPNEVLMLRVENDRQCKHFIDSIDEFRNSPEIDSLFHLFFGIAV